MVNLVGNARQQGRTELVTAAEGDHVVLSVTNIGPVMPAARVERGCWPLQRLGAAGTAAG